MKYLGVDYGKKKIGLAVSDDEGRFAFPKKVMEAGKDAVAALCGVLRDEGAGAVVIGLPSAVPGVSDNMRGEIQSFGAEISDSCAVPVEFENEVFTTRIAEMHSEKNVDASAAALILQSFLDRQQKNARKS